MALDTINYVFLFTRCSVRVFLEHRRVVIGVDHLYYDRGSVCEGWRPSVSSQDTEGELRGFLAVQGLGDGKGAGVGGHLEHLPNSRRRAAGEAVLNLMTITK